MLFKKAKQLINSVKGYFDNLFGTVIGIDLGTCTTWITVRGKGIVLREPTVVAVAKGTNQVIGDGEAVGTVAHEMLGKTPASISAIRPMKNGVICNFEATEAMLNCFIRKVIGKHIGLMKPQVVISVPSGITQVERHAVIETAERAGARKVYLVEEPMAAGIGSGLPIADPTASMIIDIGGGTTEVAIISLADIACSRSIRVGGDAMDEAIISYLKKKHNILIGEPRAEKLKIQIGSAAPLEEEMEMEVSGRDTLTGMPKKIIVTSEEIREALQEPILLIIHAVTETLESAPPELSADLIDNGVHICGGGSLLRKIDVVLKNTTGLKVTKVQNPLESVAKGTCIYIENLNLWKDTIVHPEFETA